MPLELGILIDTSRSQRDAHLDDVLKAAKEFVNDMIRGPEDRVFFLTFDVTSHATGWLKKEQLQDATLKVEIGGGTCPLPVPRFACATALYDAIGIACKQRMGARDSLKATRRVLLLISDGQNNQSRITRDEATSEALRAGAVIFTINTNDSELTFRGETMMELAMLTGGESFSLLGRKDAPKVFASIRELINGLYYLRYVPPDASKSAVHEVEVKPASKQKLELSYARKYFWNP